MLVIIFQKRLQWEDGNSLAYKYVYHGQMDVTVYECWYLDGDYPQIPKNVSICQISSSRSQNLFTRRRQKKEPV